MRDLLMQIVYDGVLVGVATSQKEHKILWFNTKKTIARTQYIVYNKNRNNIAIGVVFKKNILIVT